MKSTNDVMFQAVNTKNQVTVGASVSLNMTNERLFTHKEPDDQLQGSQREMKREASQGYEPSPRDGSVDYGNEDKNGSQRVESTHVPHRRFVSRRGSKIVYSGSR